MKIAVRAGRNGETPNVLAITAPSWRWAASGGNKESFRRFIPAFRSVPLPFSAVLRYNLFRTELFSLRLWIVASSFYLFGLLCLFLL